MTSSFRAGQIVNSSAICGAWGGGQIDEGEAAVEGIRQFRGGGYGEARFAGC